MTSVFMRAIGIAPMAAQAPVIGIFAITAPPRATGRTAVVLVLQVASAIAAALPVFLLGW